eukprot:TRINITY_DN11739_c0_g1_i1.p1 TRINITY_DN11739_c0_g1~~TRINITY_DN11739_c0_g1_i1.p1  ORF type:complete len:523 (-),score=125.74 TRINITY_DN11739_c0_g1_i1:23-1591(-)
MSNSRAKVKSNKKMDSTAPTINPHEVEILEKIGGGCFGDVFRGVCRGKDVAVKKLHVTELEDQMLEEFKKEVDIMIHLRHPNVILFMGASIEPGELMIVTELMPRGDVYSIVHDPNIHLSLLRKLQMAKDTAQGMNWLHCSDPPIIHRDLKPSNLLVDNNWNVKVCDFGLSAVQMTEKMSDNGVAPGTPLWMAPEVLQGKDLDEKSDIYSFGIVLWEILTEEEPYLDHDSYSTFVRAVCGKHERPEIPDDFHESIRHILESSWHPDPTKRPSFGELIDLIDEAIIDTTLIDPEAAELWKDNWLGEYEISFITFVNVLQEYLGLNLGRDRERNTEFRCLKALLTNGEESETATVSIEKFGLLLKWFGPLHQERKSHPVTIVDVISRTMERGWFHGDITRTRSEALLADYLSKKGTFLVRLSTTEPIEKTPFTITKVNKSKAINHQRVYAREDRRGHYVIVKIKGKSKRLTAAGGIENLLDKIARQLKLGRACPGRAYNEIFVANKVEGYLPNPEDESDSSDYY